jgi:hypothetical protein
MDSSRLTQEVKNYRPDGRSQFADRDDEKERAEKKKAALK